MISGSVTADWEAVVALRVRGASGQDHHIRGVIDTGFNGHLTLPAEFVRELRLPYHSMAIAALADGTRVALRKYEGTIIWEGQPREVIVLEAEGGPLVGMAILRGHHLAMDIVEGGSVSIEGLPHGTSGA